MKAKPLPPITPRQVSLFWSHVDKTNYCWIWKGSFFPSGYGQVKIRPRNVLAHRVSFYLANGHISEGLSIDHLCRNRACVNPSHLEQVPLKENILRAPNAVAAINASKTHCFRGHPYVETNWGRYHRVCKICLRDADLRFKAKRRLQNEHASNTSTSSIVVK